MILVRDNLISIIMPAYNSAEFIRQSIESVMNQIYPYWELLVVDDHSTDGTREIVQSYADKRICCICQSKNNGVAVARNVGINAAKGRYIAFLDSDDLWLPNKLMKQISFMKKNKYHFTYTEYRPFVDLPSNAGKLVRTSDFVDYRSLLKGNDIGCLTVMLDRAYYGKVEMPSVRHEDYVTWLNLLKPGRCAYSLHEDLARYRKSNTSLTANKWESLQWTWEVYRKTQHLSLLESAYYFSIYAIRGLRKHGAKI